MVLIEQVHVVRDASLEGVMFGQDIIGGIMDLMTPQEVLDQRQHERVIISVEQFPTFDALLQDRERIRKLELVPIRDVQSQASYAAVSKEEFLGFVVEHYLGQSEIVLVPESYPSDLSGDVEQWVIWMRDDATSSRAIAEFIAKFLYTRGLTLNDVILFERSRVSDTEFVRAAVSEVRHIHVWTRKRILRM